MNCRDFKRLINEQLDAREAPSAETERALEGHGSTCPACHAEALRFQALRLAIAAWDSPPSAPAGFADRFLEQWEHGPTTLTLDSDEPGSRSWSQWPTTYPI